MDELIDSLVEYREILEDTDREMTLSAVPRFKVDDDSQCLDESNYNDLVEINTKVSNNVSTQFSLLLIILIVQIVALVGSLTVFCCCVMCYYKKKSKLFKSIFSAFIFGLPKLILPIVIVGYYGIRQSDRDYANDKVETFDVIVDRDCFSNDDVQDAFTEYRDNVMIRSEEIWSLLFTMVAISAASIALNGTGLAIFLIKKYCGNKK